MGIRGKKGKIYALYRGDDFIDLGTLDELEERTGITRKSLGFFHSPSNLKHDHGNSYVLIDVDEDDENEQENKINNEKVKKGNPSS